MRKLIHRLLVKNSIVPYKTMELKTALDRLFDKDLDLTSRQQYILIEIIGAHSRHEFNAGFQAAKDIR